MKQKEKISSFIKNEKIFFLDYLQKIKRKSNFAILVSKYFNQYQYKLIPYILLFNKDFGIIDI